MKIKKQGLSHVYVLFVLGIILLSFVSCKQKAPKIDPEFARYISAFTYGNIASDAQIQIELSQEIPTVELNSEIKEKLFSFSPSIKGNAFWVNARTIRFIPDAGELKLGKEYQATFALDKVLKVDKKFGKFNFYFRVNEPNFTAEVFPFSPLSLSDLTWNAVEATLNLSNPTPVDEVRKMLEIKGARRETQIRIVPAGTTAYRITIDSLQRADSPKQYTLVINGKAIGSKKKLEYPLDIPAFSKENFEVVDVRILQKSDPHLRITFSDPLSPTQNLTGLVEPSGVENFTYRVDKNVLKIYPETFPKGEMTLWIHQGVRNNSGLYLDKTYNYQLQIQSDEPRIKFEKSGNILPNSEQLMLPFSAVNLWAVDVKVIKIYQNNILYYLQSSTLNNASGGELRRFGRLVMKKRLRLDGDKSLDLTKWNNFSIDLSQMMKQDPGALYMVQLTMKPEYSLYSCDGIIPQVPDESLMSRFSDNQISEEDEAIWDQAWAYYYEPMDWENYDWEERDDPCKPSYYMSRDRIEETMVTASNVGIIAKGANNKKMSVFVTDILTTNPISGAKVTLYNYQMQEIGSGKTDGDGFAEVDYKNGRPFVVTAANGNDIGYLEVKEELSLSISSFDVGGKEIQKGMKGFVYTERGVWRPGDTVHVAFILEDKEKKLPKGHPVALEVYTPQRRLFHRDVKTDGENGFYTFRFATQPTSETGVWQAFVKVGGTQFYKSIRIETIKPNRLKVRLDTDSIINAHTGVISGTLHSQWLHGAPASNLKAEVELTLSRSDNPFKGFAGYQFNNPLINFETSKTTIFEGTLNASGAANVNAEVPAAENASGMLRGSILSRVYETGGDMSFYTQTVYYSPYKAYVGVKSPAARSGEFLETDTPLAFDVVKVNAYGKPVAGHVEYAVYKLNWSWWWNSNAEDLGSYVHNTAANVVASGSATLTDGKGKITFQVDYPDWGRYLMLVNDASGNHTTGTVFYVDWPSWRGRSAKTDPNGLTMLSFSTDKPTYEVGEKATVIIPKSSQGRVLVSIENGSGILHRQWVKTSDKEDTRYTFNVTENMAPNFYVFATLLQPHAQTENDLPIRMYGVVNVNVENKNSILAPVIAMPDVLRPEKEFTVSVSEKNRKPMTYTLAIVDEGLLDLTSFRTPNAWSEFYAREALGVRTWDLFDRVLGANTGMMGALLSIGGDETLKAASDNVNRFKPVVKFLGPFTIKGGETKTHKIKLPQYVGSVRAMVVAGGNGAYGNAEKTVAVKNELMTLSTLPRVLGPGEEVWLPVNVFAMEKSIKNVQVSIQTQGLLKPMDGATQSVSFNDVGDKVLFFRLKVDDKVGTEQVVIKASGGGATFTETIDIGIRNPNPPITLTETALIDAGSSAGLTIGIGNVQPNDWGTLELSRLPSVNFSQNINYLLNYPHGCTEQVTSQGFPLLYIDEFASLNDDQKMRMRAKVDEVIRILSSRQLSDGGFTYWDGSGYASEWVSTYAGHFLVEAKNKGYDVSESILSRWVQFQRKLAQNWTLTTPYRHYYAISMVDLQQAYRLYALALNGNAELGAMNRMRELPELSLQARWRLAAAYALAGRREAANELVFNASSEVEAYGFNNDTYGTPARDQAMILETYLLLGQDEKAMQLAQTVAKALSSPFVSTQTAAFGLAAMAQLAEKMGKGNIDVDWTLNGKKMDAVNTPKAMFQTEVKPAGNLSVNVSNKGQGKIYARLTASTQPLIDTLNTPIRGSFDLSVRYVDSKGNPVDVKTLKQGAEFTAIVTVSNGVEQAFTDLALVQIFASGWEIFNDRLLGGTTESATAYTYRDIRDDRVLTYFNLGLGETKTFRVRLQAAYRGRYYLPAVSCQAMYAPQEQARNTGSWVEVLE